MGGLRQVCHLCAAEDGSVEVRALSNGGPVLLVIDNPAAFAAGVLDEAATAAELQRVRQLYSGAVCVDPGQARELAGLVRDALHVARPRPPAPGPTPEPEPVTTFSPPRLAGAGLQWTADDGPAPGVWANRPEGFRCVYALRWTTPRGVLTPDDLLPLDQASPEQLRAELADVAARPNWRAPGDAGRAAELLSAFTGTYTGAVIAFLRLARTNAPEAWAPWNPPEKQRMRPTWHPGWRPEVAESVR